MNFLHRKYKSQFQKPQSVKILQVAFPGRGADRGMRTVAVFRVKEPVIAMVYVLQTMEVIPVRTVHPTVFFGSVAPFDFCLVMLIFT